MLHHRLHKPWRAGLLLAVVAALLAGTTAGTAAAAEAPLWPLDLPTRYLTSNFMEHRSGRFHAGLDLKTDTITGFVVRAPEDGWIVRVRATPGAYGRAVYLRGVSGNTYVFAHLERFNDSLRAQLEAERLRTGTYRAHRQFGAGEMAVQRGDPLGLSGQSGTNGPHLHFEVRDRHNRPVDPQTVGFAVPDTIPPAILEVRAWPVRRETVVQGRRAAHVLRATGGLSGPQGVLRVTGPVAFSARIVEVADSKGHRLEPSLIEVRLDGEVVYRCHNERFAFSANALQRLEWVEEGPERWHWLHRRPGNDLPGRSGGLWYQGASGGGLTPGRHEVSIKACDVAGNCAEMEFVLVADRGPNGLMARESEAWEPVASQGFGAPFDSLYGVRITPFFDTVDVAALAPTVAVRKLVYRPAAGDPVQAECVVFSREKDLTPEQVRAASEQGLVPLGAGRQFVAADWPLEASLPVKIAAPAARTGQTGATWGLYRWHRQHWKHADRWPGGQRATDDATVHIDLPGTYAFLDDRTPPVFVLPDTVVIHVGPVSSTPGVTRPRWAVLAVGMTEKGAGLSAGSLRATLDGSPLIVEPDLPRDRLLVEFPDNMAPGEHDLALTIADEAGHEAVGRCLVYFSR